MLARLRTATAVIALAAGLTACAGTSNSTAPPATMAPATSDGETSEGTPSGTTPTCQNMLSPSLVAEFTAIGWTVRAEEFRINGEVVPGGVQCLWADFSVPSDHGQMFGWAPIDADAAEIAQETLQELGWIREAGDKGSYVTEDPAVASELVDGYGMTYFFGDGWVTLADTKQNLLLIAHP